MNPIVDHITNQIVVHIADHTANPLVNNSLAVNSVLDFSNKDVYYKENEIVNGYSILQIIGEGRYGIAYLAINDKYEKCLIKQLKKEMLEETREKLFYEERILQSLNSSNFPKFISKFRDEYREGYQLEYIEGRSFEDLLTKEGYTFSKADIYKIGGKLLELIEILHNNNIVHQDIRPPNIILKPNNEVALIDFGLARFIDSDKYTKEIDYWFIGDFLIHLYYSTYIDSDLPDRPWFKELNLNIEETIFLKKLMGIEGSYQNMDEIREQLGKIKSRN
ncbi:MAG: serine/threonine-protein kinase [Velocimicrobium sp.]